MVYSLNPLHSIYSQFLGPNLPADRESHHVATSSNLNNDQVIENAHKLILITKTHGFNSLSEAVFIHMKALHRPQKEAVGLFYFLIESSNLSEVQKEFKKDSKFKEFAIKCIQDMVKDEMSTIVSNPKLSMCKQYLKGITRMITIKNIVGLAKYAINCIVIAIINCYQTALSKVSYLITTSTKLFF